jgi:hypothetical protein
MNEYPMLGFIVQRGKLVAAALAVLVAAAGIWCAWSSGHLIWAMAGVVAAAVGYGLALSYVELVKLITDMLLPK